MEQVYVSAGANIAPEANIARALQLLSRSATLTGLSSFYRTPAIGRPEQPEYLNGVVRLETELLPMRLREVLRAVEHAIGRVRTKDAWAPRPIDLDILLYGQTVISGDGLEIPDPDITRRPFLAAGLLELDPALRLPGEQRALAQWTDPDAIAALKKDAAFTHHLKESLFHEP